MNEEWSTRSRRWRASTLGVILAAGALIGLAAGQASATQPVAPARAVHPAIQQAPSWLWNNWRYDYTWDGWIDLNCGTSGAWGSNASVILFNQVSFDDSGGKVKMCSNQPNSCVIPMEPPDSWDAWYCSYGALNDIGSGFAHKMVSSLTYNMPNSWCYSNYDLQQYDGDHLRVTGTGGYSNLGSTPIGNDGWNSGKRVGSDKC